MYGWYVSHSHFLRLRVSLPQNKSKEPMNPNNLQTHIVTQTYERHHDDLVRYVNARLTNWQESEDLVQDVFVKMLQLPQMINEETSRALAYAIANNMTKDRLRRRIIAAKADAYYIHTTDTAHNNAERDMQSHEIMQAVRGGLERLSPACCKVYELSLLQDLTADEIALKLNVSKRTIESQLLTSRKKMRQDATLRMQVS